MLTNLLPSDSEQQRMCKFCIALFKSDKIVLSAYVAANLFELTIDLWLTKQSTKYDSTDNLNIRIKLLDTSKYHVTHSSLMEYKNIRNDIIHGYIHSLNPDRIEKLIYFIWESLDKDSYDTYKKNIKNIDLKTAYYWIRNFEALDTKDSPNPPVQAISIEKKDFNDLYMMSDKLKALSKYISTNKRLGKHNLTRDNISNVNSSSAYVWLALTDGNYNGREKISSSSVSILATPQEIRIYLDFGGLAFKERISYFNFLSSTTTSTLEINGCNDISIFDIEWYSYTENINSINLLNSNHKIPLIEQAIQKLNACDNTIPIAWNKLLLGYIIKKQTLTFELLWERINCIIQIHNKFQEYSKKNNISERKTLLPSDINISPLYEKFTKIRN